MIARLRHSVIEAASIVRFSAEALIELRGVGRYSSEVLRQTAILVTGTTALIVFLNLLFGGVCGTFGTYALRPAGASDSVGALTAICGRTAVVAMCGYVLAAKVGCGLVAEIGSMKISDELEAFRSVGLNPMRFVVATRLAAMLLYVPFMYMVAQLAVDAGSSLMVQLIGEVSQGNWEALHWGIRSTHDMWIGFVQVAAIAITVVLVASSYGYTVQGGPTDVGAATARSMVINLVIVHVIFALASAIFYAGDVNVPFGG